MTGIRGEVISWNEMNPLILSGYGTYLEKCTAEEVEKEERGRGRVRLARQRQLARPEGCLKSK